MSKKHHLLILIFILCISAYLRLAFSDVPFFRDEGDFAYVTQVLHRGGALYEDVEDNKPPGIYLIYYTAFSLFGWESIRGVRIMTMAFSLFTVLIIYHLGKRMDSDSGGLLAAALFGFISPIPELLGYSGEAEVFLLLPLSAGYLALLCYHQDKPQGRMRFAFLCGILLGVGFCIKQVVLAYLASLLILQAIRYLQGREKHELAAILWIGAGFMVPVVVMFSYLAINHILPQFYEYCIKFSSIYCSVYPDNIKQGYMARFTEALVTMLIKNRIVLILLLLSIIYWWKGPGESLNNRLLLITWFLFSLFWIFNTSRFNNYYFNTIVPPLCLSAALTASMLCRTRSKPVNTASAILYALFLLALCISYYPYYAPSSREEKIMKVLHSNNCVWAESVGEYIRKNSSPDDPIVQWGMEFQVYFYADRICSTRHFNLYNIIVLCASGDVQAKEMLKKFQLRMIDDMNRRPPVFFILSIPNLKLTFQTEEVFVTTHVNKLLNERYNLDRCIGPYIIYRLRGELPDNAE